MMLELIYVDPRHVNKLFVIFCSNGLRDEYKCQLTETPKYRITDKILWQLEVMTMYLPLLPTNTVLLVYQIGES